MEHPGTEDLAGLDAAALKNGGFIPQRQRGRFTVRLKCPGGRVPIRVLERLAEVARDCGSDYVHLSFRQSLELPYVRFEDLAEVQRRMAEVGQEVASCGPRVRVPTACAGCEYNPNGLTDTQKMAAEVCRRFFGGRPLAHKFKMSFSGCPIDCARTSENDLGFQGAMMPVWDEDPCTGCGICADACLEGAIRSDPDTGRPLFDPSRCLYCADCIRSCPTEAWRPRKVGWVVRVGGKHGRHPVQGQVVAELIPDEKVPEVIEAVLAWYEGKAEGRGRVRIGTLLQEEAVWREFLEAIRPVLGAAAVEAPPPPRPAEIHRSALPGIRPTREPGLDVPASPSP